MYITFDEYRMLGGKITEDSTFTILGKRAERKLDVITFNRLKTATTIPDEVKELLVLYVDMLNNNPTTTDTDGTVKTYSNGIESVTYEVVSDDTVQKRYKDLAKEYLGNTGLLYRGTYDEDE